HLLISAKPKVSVTVMVKKLKGITGKWLFQAFPDEMRKYFWHSHIWSPNYYVGSVGNTTEAIVKKYIETQKERPFKWSLLNYYGRRFLPLEHISTAFMTI